MSQKIDLEKAAEAEAFGALAIRSGHRDDPRDKIQIGSSGLTPAQARVLAAHAKALLESAKVAGAQRAPITLDDVTFEVHESGSIEILSIRRALA